MEQEAVAAVIIQVGHVGAGKSRPVQGRTAALLL